MIHQHPLPPLLVGVDVGTASGIELFLLLLFSFVDPPPTVIPQARQLLASPNFLASSPLSNTRCEPGWRGRQE